MTAKRKRQTPLPVQSRLTGETVARNQVKRHLGKALAAREVTLGETPVPSLWLAVEASPFVLHALVRCLRVTVSALPISSLNRAMAFPAVFPYAPRSAPSSTTKRQRFAA